MQHNITNLARTTALICMQAYTYSSGGCAVQCMEPGDNLHDTQSLHGQQIYEYNI